MNLDYSFGSFRDFAREVFSLDAEALNNLPKEEYSKLMGSYIKWLNNERANAPKPTKKKKKPDKDNSYSLTTPRREKRHFGNGFKK